MPVNNTFGRDVEFLRKYTDVILLADKSGTAQVAVVPAWQGRVMTTTADGLLGTSFGWVNRKLIASGKIQAHINAFGGEDRLWLGPEGGQFSIFHAPDSPFDLEHWQTPAALDTEPFRVVRKSSSRVLCRHEFVVTNHSGAKFEIQAEREVRLLSAPQFLKKIHITTPRGLQTVAYESINTVKNTGERSWAKRTGLISIWVLGMFNASADATIVVPFVTGPKSRLGPIVNDSYFGKVPAERLIVRDDVILFRADAKWRSKIGLSPKRAKPLLGSYDALTRTLTIVEYTLPKRAKDYVNSMWQVQKQPFAGDVVNGYNDGPPMPGASQMGQFFELESSSPALALKSGAAASHRHVTIHIQGNDGKLDEISRTVFGVSLESIENAFK